MVLRIVAIVQTRGFLLATLAVLLLVLTCWVGIKGLSRARRAAPAPEPQIVAAAIVPALVYEAPAIFTPPEAPLANAENIDALPTDEDLPELAPDEERKPEEIASQPPKLAKAPPAKRSNLSEEDLRKQLAATPEFGLSQAARQALVKSYSELYKGSAGVNMTIKFDPFTLLHHFPQAAVLPIRSAANCQLGTKEAATLGVLAKKLHAYLDAIAPVDENGKRAKPTRLREVLRDERRGKRPEWLRVEALPAMLQILMAEDVPLRLMLVDMISEIDARPATVALAHRVVYDLAPEVREAAINALRGRPRADSRPVFIDALRYPWAPVADHAADALVELSDGEAVPLLVALLGKPDPAAPYASGKDGTAVRHLVRVNHLANCLLCHAPAQSGRDPVIGRDPSVTITTSGSSGGGGKWKSKQSGTGQSQGGGGGGWRRRGMGGWHRVAAHPCRRAVPAAGFLRIVSGRRARCRSAGPAFRLPRGHASSQGRRAARMEGTAHKRANDISPARRDTVRPPCLDGQGRRMDNRSLGSTVPAR
jgi:hypothetical protein